MCIINFYLLTYLLTNASFFISCSTNPSFIMHSAYTALIGLTSQSPLTCSLVIFLFNLLVSLIFSFRVVWLTKLTTHQFFECMLCIVQSPLLLKLCIIYLLRVLHINVYYLSKCSYLLHFMKCLVLFRVKSEWSCLTEWLCLVQWSEAEDIDRNCHWTVSTTQCWRQQTPVANLLSSAL